MKRPPYPRKNIRHGSPPVSIETGGWFKSGFFALVFHIGLIALLSFNLKPLLTKIEPSVYRVTLRALPAKGNEPGLGSSAVNVPDIPAEKPKMEQPKPVITPEKDKNVAGLKPSTKKDDAEKKKEALKALQAAMDKKRALEKIKERLASREKSERGSGLLGSGTAGGVPGGVPGGSSDYLTQLSNAYESKVKEYIGWNLIDEEFKGRTDLITKISVKLDKSGNILNIKFEQGSTNIIYDQRTMRALKKNMRLPPIPPELNTGDDTIEFTFNPKK